MLHAEPLGGANHPDLDPGEVRFVAGQEEPPGRPGDCGFDLAGVVEVGLHP